MERQTSVCNGVITLPIGFRFRPTDEELLVHYLKRKALAVPLPASVIPDFNVFLYDPWALPGDLREKRYFFSKRKYSKIIPTGSGFWKFMGKSKQVLASGRNQVVGARRSLPFYKGKHPHGCRTRWIMHEYHLLESISTQSPVGKVEDWVVCLIYQRKGRPKGDESFAGKRRRDCNLGIGRPSYIDFKMEDSFDLAPPKPYSPSSDDIDEDETGPYI
ncbi:hypothetical protein Nepgr_025722 [Nepenthes gracilis]|uniref:NAC domain-containing protein n=1 Tax=Nepenthes gracilis TaxID=150966 RepID=A0AAD3Y1C0_NEPGR|nr:hypothetical protein Nepgr_025722 [Nepenthes gracilis]